VGFIFKMKQTKETELMKELKDMEMKIAQMKHDFKVEELKLERGNQKAFFEDQMSIHRLKRKDAGTAMLLKNRLIREGKRS